MTADTQSCEAGQHRVRSFILRTLVGMLLLFHKIVSHGQLATDTILRRNCSDERLWIMWAQIGGFEGTSAWRRAKEKATGGRKKIGARYSRQRLCVLEIHRLRHIVALVGVGN